MLLFFSHFVHLISSQSLANFLLTLNRNSIKQITKEVCRITLSYPYPLTPSPAPHSKPQMPLWTSSASGQDKTLLLSCRSHLPATHSALHLKVIIKPGSIGPSGSDTFFFQQNIKDFRECIF